MHDCRNRKPKRKRRDGVSIIMVECAVETREREWLEF
jgi:hypothetical protein